MEKHQGIRPARARIGSKTDGLLVLAVRAMDADLLDALDRRAPSTVAAPGPAAMTVRDESESVQRNAGKMLATVRVRESARASEPRAPRTTLALSRRERAPRA